MKNISNLFFLSLVSFSVFSQKKEIKLYYSPQYLFVNAIKLDFEIELDSVKSSALMITPYIQMGKTNIANGAYEKSNKYEYDSYNYYGSSQTGSYSDDLLGFGLGISQKKYLLDGREEGAKHYPYFHYGISYLYSKITYTYYEGGYYDNLLYTYVQGTSKQGRDEFNIINFQTTMGDRIEMGNVFNLDIYAGIGLKYSDVSSSAKGYRNYARNIFDYGYTGIHPVVGARLGFDIR